MPWVILHGFKVGEVVLLSQRKEQCSLARWSIALKGDHLSKSGSFDAPSVPAVGTKVGYFSKFTSSGIAGMGELPWNWMPRLFFFEPPTQTCHLQPLPLPSPILSPKGLHWSSLQRSSTFARNGWYPTVNCKTGTTGWKCWGKRYCPDFTPSIRSCPKMYGRSGNQWVSSAPSWIKY